MQSMQKPKPADDPHDILVVTPDAVRVAPDPVRVAPDPVRVAPDPVRVTPDPVKVAPAEEEFSSPAPDAVRAPSGRILTSNRYSGPEQRCRRSTPRFAQLPSMKSRFAPPPSKMP